MAEYSYRFENNVPGSYYVDENCIDCDLCRERAPELFHRHDQEAHSFVARQPKTEEEIALCEDALESCPVEAIGNDGPSGDCDDNMSVKNRCQLPGIVQQ